MDAASRRRITVALSGPGAEHGMCAACALLIGASGAAITVVTDAGHRGVLCSSNAAAEALEDIQVTLGEGPGIDAHRFGVPVTDADLTASTASRWLAFCAPAVEAGAAAVFAFPLRLGGIHLGTLTFNNDRAGRLTDDQYEEALFMVAVVTQSVLSMQAHAAPGAVAAALEALVGGGEVHQAAGMFAVRLGISVPEALVRLRALAYLAGRPLADVAASVIAGREDLD